MRYSQAKRAINMTRRVAYALAALIVLFSASTVSIQESQSSSSIMGRVVGVADGDTITILNAQNTSFKIRLSSIDAPEKAQDFGQKSKQSLSDLVYGQDVTVSVVDTDRYGRTVGIVFLDNTNINAEQVRRGMAWVYTKYNKDRSLVGIESQARQSRIGLWSQPNPTPPWEYRRK